MKLLRLAVSILLVFCLAPLVVLFGSGSDERPGTLSPYLLAVSGNYTVSSFPEPFGSEDADYEDTLAPTEFVIIKTPTDGGIREEVPDKYRARFDKWKSEFLSTDLGRQQWDTYANNQKFILTIKVSGDKGKGAGTDKFLWNDTGDLVGATITLGSDLDDGYPTPVYYPVLNSLSTTGSSYSISGKILAASKISHEIGHVNQADAASMKTLQLQSKLTPVYISIFLKNGLNSSDNALVDLAKQMGGTPTELWESREYWSEINAMLYLKERISKEFFYCHVFNRIRQNLKDYAGAYEQRFDQYPEYSNSPCWK